ncbi:MAG: hypothetical protein AAGA10_07740 [Bacteroidota bacterium]
MLNPNSWHPYLYGIVGVSFILGILLASESLPYVYHPDEPVLLKQPFKRIIQYRAGDFSSQFSLYDLLLTTWLGITYLLGYLMGLFEGISHFREELILESSTVIFSARMLSVVLVCLGNGLLFSFIAKETHKKPLALLFALLFLTNPFLLVSAYKIKFEALVYFCSIFLFTRVFPYFSAPDASQRRKVYFWAILALAVRIELIVFLLLILIFDSSVVGIRRSSLNRFTQILRPIGWGIVAYCLITLYPLTLLHQFLGKSPELGLVTGHTFGGNVLMGLFTNLKNEEIPTRIQENGEYYLPLLFSIFFFPLLTCILTIQRKHLWWLLYPLGILTFLLVNTLHFPRYLLPVSTGFLLILFINYRVSPTKRKHILFGISLSLVSFLLIAAQFILVSLSPDPRTQAKEFILAYTHPEDLLAMETLSGAGSYPPLWECKDQMVAKAQYAQAYSPYMGTKYQIQIQRNMTFPCRRILDICEINYLGPNPQTNSPFLNTKDLAHFRSLAPKYFISVYTLDQLKFIYPAHTLFYEALKKDYFLVKFFPKNLDYFDPRMKLLNTRKPVYVYKKA